MNIKSRLLASATLAVTALSGAALAQKDPNYRFVMVSHIGSNDPNMNWLTIRLRNSNGNTPM